MIMRENDNGTVVENRVFNYFAEGYCDMIDRAFREYMTAAEEILLIETDHPEHLTAFICIELLEIRTERRGAVHRELAVGFGGRRGIYGSDEVEIGGSIPVHPLDFTECRNGSGEYIVEAAEGMEQAVRERIDINSRNGVKEHQL